MAEVSINGGVSPTHRTDNTRPDENEDPLLESNDEIGMPDSPEGYEYSSGSDRSYDAEDGESSEGTPSKSKSCARRMQRNGSHGSRRHKGGSRHKKTFQPYPPQDETNLKRRSKERKEKECAAADVRKDVTQEFITFPVAPFNSTQFLMDEQSSTSTGMKTPSHPKLESSPPASDKSVVEENLSQDKDRDFSDVYTSVHAESLQSLSKEELVKHYMGLEEKIALLQKQVKQRKINGDSSFSGTSEDFMDISVISKPMISVGGEDSSSNRKVSSVSS